MRKKRYNGLRGTQHPRIEEMRGKFRGKETGRGRMRERRKKSDQARVNSYCIQIRAETRRHTVLFIFFCARRGSVFAVGSVEL